MRNRAKLKFVPTVLAYFLALPVHSEVARIEWADLIDETAQNYEDPFVELTGKQLNALRKLVRLRAQQEKGGSTPELMDQFKLDIEATEANLAEEGVDANWLISQRWVVVERREKAGAASNVDIDGLTVSLGGFVIPGTPRRRWFPNGIYRAGTWNVQPRTASATKPDGAFAPKRFMDAIDSLRTHRCNRSNQGRPDAERNAGC